MLMKVLDSWYNMSLLDYHINVLQNSFIVDCAEYASSGLPRCYCNNEHLLSDVFYRDCEQWLAQAKNDLVKVEKGYSCFSSYLESHITAKLQCQRASWPYEYDWDTRSCRVEFTSQLSNSIGSDLSFAIFWGALIKIAIAVSVQKERNKIMKHSLMLKLCMKTLQRMKLSIYMVQLCTLAWILYRATWTRPCNVEDLQSVGYNEPNELFLIAHVLCTFFVEGLIFWIEISQMEKMQIIKA